MIFLFGMQYAPDFYISWLRVLKTIINFSLVPFTAKVRQDLMKINIVNSLIKETPMKKYSKFFAAAICLLVLISMLTISAAAEEAVVKEAAPAEEAVSAEPEKAKAAELSAEEENKTHLCNKDEVLYAERDTVIFNNGGTVYNNGGTVYNNGAELFSHDGKAELSAEDDATAEIEAPAEAEDEEKPEVFEVEFASDYSKAMSFEHLDKDGKLFLSPDEQCRFSAKPGFIISFAETSSGTLSLEDDGSYILRDVDKDAVLSIEYRPEKPEMSLESGAYTAKQNLEIVVHDGVKVFYTTDGSDPNEKSKEYKKPLKIDESCPIKAVAISEEGLSSEITELSLNILEIDVPEFEDVKEGYNEIEPQALVIKNPGSISADIQNITLGGKNPLVFTISHTAGRSIPANGVEEDFWEIYPQYDLKKGSYSAKICIKFKQGKDAVFDISFNVK